MVAIKNLRLPDYVRRYSLITAGCIMYAVGVVIFLQAGGLAGGGVTGVALIINELTGFSAGITIFIVNVPLLLWGWKAFGRDFFLSTLYVIALSSALMWLAESLFFTWLPSSSGVWLLPLTESYLVNAVAGGAIYGFGLGLIFRCGSSSGGTDIPIKIIRKKFRHISTGVITMVADLIIVAFSAFAYKENTLEVLFYTVLSIIVFTIVIDRVLYGGNSAKMVFIISAEEPARRIGARVLKELDAGATIADAKGAYSGTAKKVLLCVVKPVAYPRLRDIVREEDKEAFMIVSSAKEIYGEGYIPPDSAEL